MTVGFAQPSDLLGLPGVNLPGPFQVFLELKLSPNEFVELLAGDGDGVLVRSEMKPEWPGEGSSYGPRFNGFPDK